MTKNDKIRNGNRYVSEESGKGVFARDVDRLFHEYTNLRMSLYNKHKNSFTNQETKNELMSYIDEQFIKLVKEYEINSPIDFPGYVKTKLSARVSQGFVRGRYRDKSREVILRGEHSLQDMIEQEGVNNLESIEMNDLLNHIFGGLELSESEEDIVRGWLLYETDKKIVDYITETYGETNASVRENMRKLRKEVKVKIEEY